ADMGAEVIRIDRPRPSADAGAERADILARGRRSVSLDLGKPEAADAVLGMIDKADVLIEGCRPGVMDRLGRVHDVCLGRSRRLVDGGRNGWGQYVPLSHAAGHDNN